MKDTEEVEELGEESGRDEAACDFPVVEEVDYRVLCQYGRGRAQGLYGLRGKQARRFAQSWAVGYQATFTLLHEDHGDWGLTTPSGRHFYGLQE